MSLKAFAGSAGCSGYGGLASNGRALVVATLSRRGEQLCQRAGAHDSTASGHIGLYCAFSAAAMDDTTIGQMIYAIGY